MSKHTQNQATSETATYITLPVEQWAAYKRRKNAGITLIILGLIALISNLIICLHANQTMSGLGIAGIFLMLISLPLIFLPPTSN